MLREDVALNLSIMDKDVFLKAFVYSVLMLCLSRKKKKWQLEYYFQFPAIGGPSRKYNINIYIKSI